MSSFTVKDNSRLGKLATHQMIQELANKDLSVLAKNNFIIFPQQLSESDDLDKDQYLFQQRNEETWTCNVVGIISDSKDDIRINSRFSKTNHEDYFLRYMIQTVLNYNVTNNKVAVSQEMSYYDLLIFLFPYFLNAALKKGIYKEYVRKEYNDANIKGPIDVARHIRKNVPFYGKVAYRTREFSYDNHVTELIRHTIEKVQLEQNFLLANNEDTKENVRLIKQLTPAYSRIDRASTLQASILNPVKHSYFEEYAILQKLCNQILTEEKTGFGDDQDQVHGIIIDVAWLWEEYIWKITNWKHYGRKKELAKKQLFKKLGTESQQHRYPDFEYMGIPIDTKYKRKIDKRNDYNQLTTYIHIMQSSIGGFLQPTDKFREQGYTWLGELYGGGELFSYKLYIPQEYEDYADFQKQMKQSENQLKKLDIKNNNFTI